MKNRSFGLLVAAGIGLLTTLAACDNAAPSAPATVAETPPPAPPPPPEPALLNKILKWSVTKGGSTSVTDGTVGDAKLKKDSILSVVNFQSPVAAGDTLVIKAKITAPAERELRVYIQRHCDALDEVDSAFVDFPMTGAPVDIEVKHTFSKAYGCARLSVVPKDRDAVDLNLTDISFYKLPTP